MAQEIFHPAEFIKEELEERGWSYADLASILGKSPRFVTDLMSERKRISAEIADDLGRAFGTSASLWLNLESAYQLARLNHDADREIERKAELYSKVPVSKMKLRMWLSDTTDVDLLEKETCRFLRVKSIADTPSFLKNSAARKSSQYSSWLPEQTAWLARSWNLASGFPCGNSFSKSAFGSALEALVPLKSAASLIHRIPKVLNDAGVRFLIVEHLKGSKIDGACFWLDSNSPVVVLTFRFDRIDNFWFTLMHELGHVLLGHGKSEPTIDIDLNAQNGEGDLPEQEVQANDFAREWLLKSSTLDDFLARAGATLSRRKIEAFAAKQRVHPGIVIGQLQKRGRLEYRQLRALLEEGRTRQQILDTAIVDGWGSLIKV